MSLALVVMVMSPMVRNMWFEVHVVCGWLSYCFYVEVASK